MRRLTQVTLVVLLACMLCVQVSAFSLRALVWRSHREAPKHDPAATTEVATAPDSIDAPPSDPVDTVPPPPVWTRPVGPPRPGHTDPVQPWRPHGERRRLPPFHRPRHDEPRIRPIGPEHPPANIRPVGPEVPSNIRPVGPEDTDIHPVGPEIPIHPVGPEDGEEARIRPVGPEVPQEEGDSGEMDIHPVGPEIPIRPVGPEDPDIHPVGPEVPIHPVGPEGQEGEMHILPVGPETSNSPPLLGEGGEKLPPGIDALPQEDEEGSSSSQSSLAKFIAKLRDRLRSGMEQSPISVILPHRGSASSSVAAVAVEEPAQQNVDPAQMSPVQEPAQDFEPGFPEPAPMPMPMPPPEEEEPAAVMPGQSGEDMLPPFDGPIPDWDTSFTDQDAPTDDGAARPRARHVRRSYALNLWVAVGAGIALIVMLGIVIAQRRKMTRLSAEMELLRMHMQYQQGGQAQIVSAVPQSQQQQVYAVAMPAQMQNGVSYMPLANAPQQGYVAAPVQGYPSSGYVRLQPQQTVQ